MVRATASSAARMEAWLGGEGGKGNASTSQVDLFQESVPSEGSFAELE